MYSSADVDLVRTGFDINPIFSLMCMIVSHGVYKVSFRTNQTC